LLNLYSAVAGLSSSAFLEALDFAMCVAKPHSTARSSLDSTRPERSAAHAPASGAPLPLLGFASKATRSVYSWLATNTCFCPEETFSP
jgi:hypothetical protein